MSWLYLLVFLVIFILIASVVYTRFLNPSRVYKTIQAQGIPAFAESLVDAEPIAAAKMQRLGDYSGPEVFIPVPARILPSDGTPPYDGEMHLSLLVAAFVRSGVKVAVKLDPRTKTRAVLTDTIQEIVDHNPQLRRQS